MKVCFYFGVFARNGGIEEFTRDLSLALLESGVGVEIVCASLRHPILDELKVAGARITRIPIYWGCRWHIPDYALLPFALARVGKADVVIHRKPLVGWFYRLLAKKNNIYITSYRPKEQFPDAGDRYRFYSFFKAIYTQEETFRDDVSSCGVGSILEVLPLIPPRIYDTSLRKGSDGILKVGMLGRLEPQKDPLYALRIVEALSKRLPDGIDRVELHIHGTGSIEETVRRESGRHGFSTVFHGRYRRADIPGIVRDNDLFLITSVSEGQCIVALEVLAGGRPLFATPVGALSKILADDVRGSLLPVDAAEDAADGIADWLKHHGDVGVVDIQRSYLADFDRDKVEQRYVELIKNTVALS